MATPKATTAPIQYPLAVEDDFNRFCVVDKEVFDKIDYVTVTLEDQVATMPDGTSVLSMVFRQYGYDRYVEAEERGELKLGTIDNIPLNCKLSNITIYPI